MGCDIHLYSETKKNGQWVADAAASFSRTQEYGEDYEDIHLDSPYHERNYRLFGLLAEVRWPCTQSFAQRDMPEDASQQVAELYISWGSDAHSASYLTVEELQAKAMELLIDPSEDALHLRGDLDRLLGVLPVTTPEAKDRRIVFWFDN